VVKGFMLFLILFGVVSALIFLGNQITKRDIFTTGKLILAALASLVVSITLYILEMG